MTCTEVVISPSPVEITITPNPVTIEVGGITQGVAGPPGARNSDAIEHTQSSPSSSWAIDVPEAMGRRPVVTIYIGDELVLADVEATSTSVNITFPSPVSGSAVLA